MHRRCVITFGLVLALGLVAVAQGQTTSRPAPEHEVRREKSVMVPMRDSVRLATDLYFPVGAEMPQPVVLIRTPYNKNDDDENAAARFFASQGYVAAVQDMRGKYESEGRYQWTATDRRDGSDTVDWLAEQSWSTGKVGTYGCSYRGENQIQLAATRNPHHAAAVPMFAGAMYTNGDRYRNWATNNGGAFELAMIFTWFREKGWSLRPRYPPSTPREDLLRATKSFNLRPQLPEIDERALWNALPVVDMMERSQAPPNLWEELVTHTPNDPWWDQFQFVTDADSVDVPALQVASWYDYGVSEALGLFTLFQNNGVSATARENQFIVIAPTTHCEHHAATAETVVGERSVGDARLDYWSLYLRWFDHWLRGADNGVTERPTIQYYLMGKNEWRTAESWPLAATQFTRYYLHSGGDANSRMGDGRLTTSAPGDEPADTFTYDPATPVPTVGGQACCTQTPKSRGAWDQRTVEMRNDVLVYTSPPLEEGVEVTGPLKAVLYVSSSAKDTDFTVKLVDVAPDGTAYNVQEGIQRARYRTGYENVTWMEEDEVYRVTVNLHATSNYFAPGHRIRVEVSSSNFPRFTRNLNTGGDNHTDTAWTTARNTIHHSAEHPSHVVLPIIDP
jgi:hypothetical protein